MSPIEDGPSRTTEFASLPLSSSLVEVIASLGYAKMTEIQSRAIPLLLEGKDLVGQSRTGSGKTAAFAIPILEKMRVERRTVTALVLCPTRELCAQVAREIRRLGRDHAGLQVLVLAGGQPIRPQESALAKGAHVAVGTPGRLIDLLRREALVLSDVRTVVLDEADRMLDMGFQADVEEVLRATPRTRQTVLFSATFPSSIESMSRAHQRNPERITIADETATAPDVQQLVRPVAAEQKTDALLQVLARPDVDSAIVFCNLKATVTQVHEALRRAGASSDALHGDFEQFDRDRILAKFRNGSTRILVATDVAARGIDVADLDLVVNFDLPTQAEIYVHRIGRTARAGKKGIAVSLATPRDADRITMIERTVGTKLERLEGSPSPLDEASRAQLRREARMETLLVSGGRKEKVRPGDLLGALTGEAGGLTGEDVGAIEIHDHFSYVAVSRQVSRVALERLANGRIKGRRFRVSLAR